MKETAAEDFRNGAAEASSGGTETITRVARPCRGSTAAAWKSAGGFIVMAGL